MLHGLDALPGRMTGVVGVKHQLDASAFVLAIDLGERVVVADQQSASNALQVEYSEVIARTVVQQVPGPPLTIP